MATPETNRNTNKPIPIPVGRRLERMRVVAGPLVLWLGAIVIAALLYLSEGQTEHARGIVMAKESTLTTLADARLIDLQVALFDEVSPGEVVAVFDDSEIRGEMKVLQAEGEQLRAQITAERARLERESGLEAADRQLQLRRLQLDLDDAELDVLDRQVEIATGRVELERLRLRESRFSEMTARGVSERLDYEDIQMQAAALEEQLRQSHEALMEARKQVAAAQEREQAYLEMEEIRLPEVETMISPLRKQIDVLSARLELTEARLRSLVLRSPLEGVVSGVFASAGENVPARAPVVQISSPAAQTIVAYLPETTRAAADLKGLTVDIRETRQNGSHVSGRVVAIGPTVVAMPVRILKNPNFQEYGRPVMVELPANSSFVPGEIAYVQFPIQALTR